MKRVVAEISWAIAKGNQEITRLALVSANLGLHVETQAGDKFDTLKNDLGEDLFSRLRGDAGFSIEAIHYYQRGLSSLQGHGRSLSVASLSENGSTDVSEGQVEKIRQVSRIAQTP